MGEIFGYDCVNGKLVVNEEEAAVVKFIVKRQEEYLTNPPEELVQIVFEEMISRDKRRKITIKQAREKAKDDSRIMFYVTRDVAQEFGEEMLARINKKMYQSAAFPLKDYSEKLQQSLEKPHELILDRETFNKVQAEMKSKKN